MPVAMEETQAKESRGQTFDRRHYGLNLCKLGSAINISSISEGSVGGFVKESLLSIKKCGKLQRFRKRLAKRKALAYVVNPRIHYDLICSIKLFFTFDLHL